jgi:hypothetical protein
VEGDEIKGWSSVPAKAQAYEDWLKANPLPNEDVQVSGPLGYYSQHLGKSHMWNTSLGRQLDPAQYKGLVQPLSNTEVFVPKSNVSKLPGWTNTESYNHKDLNYNWTADMGPLLAFADMVGMATTGIPIGSAVGAVSNYAGGEEKAGNQFLRSGATQFIGNQLAGLGGGDSILGTGYSTGSQALNSAISNAVTQGGLAALAGGDVGKAALMGGITGGLSTQMGDVSKNISRSLQQSGLSESAAQLATKALTRAAGSALGGAIQGQSLDTILANAVRSGTIDTLADRMVTDLSSVVGKSAARMITKIAMNALSGNI